MLTLDAVLTLDTVHNKFINGEQSYVIKYLTKHSSHMLNAELIIPMNSLDIDIPIRLTFNELKNFCNDVGIKYEY